MSEKNGSNGSKKVSKQAFMAAWKAYQTAAGGADAARADKLRAQIKALQAELSELSTGDRQARQAALEALFALVGGKAFAVEGKEYQLVRTVAKRHTKDENGKVVATPVIGEDGQPVRRLQLNAKGETLSFS